MTDTTERVDDLVTSAADVVVEEPPLPHRTRRPIDSLRLLFVVVGIGALVALAIVAERTLNALTQDLAAVRQSSGVPRGVIEVVDTASDIASAWLTPVIVAMLMLRGRLRSTVEVIAAGSLGALAAALTSFWLREHAPDRLQASFVPEDLEAQSVWALPALLVAVITVISRLDMGRIRQIAWGTIGASLAVGLFDGRVTVAGILTTLGIGRIVGLLVRLTSGQPSVSPDGHTVAEALKSNGYAVTKLVSDPIDQYRRYIAESAQGSLGVLIVDRDREGAGTLARTIDRIRTREEVLPKQAVTMRTAVDQITLQSLAAARAGARTPQLRSVLRIGTDATAVIYDHIPGQALEKLAADELSDEMLHDLWRQLSRLRRNQVAHRRLSGRTILVSDTGKMWLLDPSGGEVAASDLAIRADLAQALVAVGLVSGADRAVDTAVKVLGSNAVRQAIPLLQPVALPGFARHEIKGRREVLSELRDAVTQRTGGEPDEQVKLQRFKPLSLLTGVGALVAVYLVGTQLSDFDVAELWAQTDWRWLLLAAAAVVGSYVGAALGILGFVPEKVPFMRTLAAQVALSFLRLVAPTTVGTVAVNIRLLTKAGVPGPLATASIAANQVGQVAVTVPLIAALGVITGSNTLSGLDLSPLTLLIVLGVVLIGALLLVVPSIRNRIRSLLNDFAERGLPRLLEVLASPRKLLMAVGGILLQAASFVVCLWACLKAVGETADIASLAVVQMVGNTLGMAVPTPGGLGAVEAALTAGVSTLGVSGTQAVSAVLVFRLMTFWLPMAPGWFLWTQMQRRDLL